ncbi:acid phosphatase [Caulobacter sp. DWR1-3-2b1]|uniref:acid phosphatase n=1 Tax=Caulobacter sp. DWR1-3-2b1 TaxID=2804670 RepID=UPI003CF18EFC
MYASWRASWTIGLAGLLLASCASLPGGAPSNRYLAKSAFDARDHLPPPPAKGSPEALRDREIFLGTRPLKDTPRWSLAQADNVEERILEGYACALGVTPTFETTPKLAATLLRMSRDVRSAVAGPKLKYRRPRPYLSAEGPICVRRSPGLTLSPDYPSGHSTWGWSVGLLLAEVAPDRSEAILARARAFGESRIACGVHNASSVEAGRMNAQNLFTALKRSDAFQADLVAVRVELDAARAAGPTPDKARCEAESALLSRPLL